MEEIIATFAGMDYVKGNTDNRFFLKMRSLYLVVEEGIVVDWFLSNETNDPDGFYTKMLEGKNESCS